MINQDVQNRVDAYMGNPVALQQRYSMTRDLLDLLALQKIKSQKDAAARELQLQMAGQPGSKPPTVAQQRGQELLDDTKGEIVQQVGDTLRQMQQAQQAQQAQQGQQGQQPPQAPEPGQAPQALQNPMAGGIASAPGARRMAAGGMIAFDDGGSTDKKSEKKDVDTSSLPSGYRALLEAVRAGKEALTSEEAVRQLQTFPQAFGATMSGVLPAGVQALGAALGLVPRAPQQIPPSTGAYPQEFERGAAAGLGSASDVVTPGTSPAATTVTAPPPRPRPRAAAPAPAAVAPLPAVAAPAPVTPEQAGPPQINPFAQGLAAMAAANPAAEEEARMKRMQGLLAPSQERAQKLLEEQIAAIRAGQAPKRSREQQIAEALMNMGSSRYLGFGIANAARAESAAQEAERARDAEMLKQIFALQQKGVDVERADLKDVIAAGNKAYDDAMKSRMESTKAGAQMVTEEQKMRSTEGIHAADRKSIADVAALDRESKEKIAKWQVDAQRAATAAQREGTTEIRRQTLLASITNNQQRAIADVERIATKRAQSIQAMVGPKGPTPEQAREMQVIDAWMERERANINRTFGEEHRRAMGGSGGTSGWTVREVK